MWEAWMTMKTKLFAAAAVAGMSIGLFTAMPAAQAQVRFLCEPPHMFPSRGLITPPRGLATIRNFNEGFMRTGRGYWRLRSCERLWVWPLGGTRWVYPDAPWARHMPR